MTLINEAEDILVRVAYVDETPKDATALAVVTIGSDTVEYTFDFSGVTFAE